ncbi:MAG: nitroreductase family protein [Thermoanaerobaculia bacterium]
MTGAGPLPPREEEHPRDPLEFARLSEAEMIERAREFLGTALRRRSVREFSSDPIPDEVIELAIRAAASAPSGANMQPWKFVVVRDPELKRRIRIAAEQEEKESYERRMPDEWLAALAPLGTDWHKEFLEIAPLLIVVFREDYHLDGEAKIHHYYVGESVGIASGMLLAALNAAGLATLTHTPSPMGFLREILGRPANEKPFLLIPVGYPAGGATVPRIRKKPLDEIMIVR